MSDVCYVKNCHFYSNWGGWGWGVNKLCVGIWGGGGGGANKLGGLVFFEKIIDWGGPNRLKWV